MNVGSEVHYHGKINFDDLMHEKSPSPKPINFVIPPFYANSKLANSLFNIELAKRLEGTGVHTYCLCPGLVATQFGKSNNNQSLIKKYIIKMIQYVFAKTPEEVRDSD